MSPGKANHVWFLCKRPAEGESSVCPKTGTTKRSEISWMWLFPVAGLLSLIWFLIRVVPKPSRATYPCQRVAAPLASGFVVWLAGLLGSALAYRKASDSFISRDTCWAVSVLQPVSWQYGGLLT